MNLKEEELVDIADRMLEKLEREYQEINGLGGKVSVECPEEEEEEEEEPEGYQVIGDADEDGPAMMSGDEDEEGDEANDEKDHSKHEQHSCATATPSAS